MALTPGSIPPRQGEGSQIPQDEGVHPGVLELLQVRREGVGLAVAGHGVHRGVDPDAVAVGKGYRLRQLLRGEIPCKGPHPKGCPRQIHRVGSVEHRHPQPLKVPCR